MDEFFPIMNRENLMVSIDILPFLKEGDSYDVAKSAIVSAGTFDPCELFTSFAKHSCREYCLWELALRNRDILAHRHEHNLTCTRFKGKGHSNSVLKNEVCACPYGSKDLLCEVTREGIRAVGIRASRTARQLTRIKYWLI